MPDDYYLVLGISREADAEQIKKAYRRVVKKYHPDIRPVKKAVEKLTEAREAYETLRDTERRRRYDAQRSVTAREKRSLARPQKFRNAAPARHRGGAFDSLVDEFFDGILPGFFPRQDRGPLQKDIVLEVTLSTEEALHGGLFTITVPVYEPCGHCMDQDSWGAAFCLSCSGSGYVRAHRAFSLSIPPRTLDGTQVRLSLEDIGLYGAFLHVFVRVSPFAP